MTDQPRIPDGPPARGAGRKLRRYAAIGAGVLLALLLLVKLLLPVVLSRGGVRASIERTVAREIGGTVGFGKLRVNLLPRPALTVREVKIDIPGTLSATVASARVSIRRLPLLRGRISIKEVTLVRPVITVAQAGPSEGHSQPASTVVGKALAATHLGAPDLSLKIAEGSLRLERDGTSVLEFKDLEAHLAFVSGPTARRESPAYAPGERYHLAGGARAVIGGSVKLPGQAAVSIGRLDAEPERLTVADARVQFLDLDVGLEGSAENPFSEAPAMEVSASGTIGVEAASWLGTAAGLPGDVKLRVPLRVSAARLRSGGAGKSSWRELAGVLAAADGPTLSFEARQEPGLLSIRQLQLKDTASDVRLSGVVGDQGLELKLAGRLERSTMGRLFAEELLPLASLKADFRLRVPSRARREATAEGTVEGAGLRLPAVAKGFVVDRFAARARERTVTFNPIEMRLGQDTLSAVGTAAFTDRGVALDFDVAAGSIDVASVLAAVTMEKSPAGGAPSRGTGTPVSVEARVRARVQSVAYAGYRAENVSVAMAIAPGRTTANLERATLCGISLDGDAAIDGRGIALTLRPKARGRMLDEDARCLFPGKVTVTGTYDLAGAFTASGPREALLRSLEGTFDFSARNGRVYNAKIAEGIAAYLDMTTVTKGSSADLLKNGVRYDSITLRGALKGGVLDLAKVAFKSKQVNVAAEGAVDLRKQTLGLSVLVAPLSGIDRALSKIPVVRSIAGNALVVVPVRVEGSFSKPEIKHLPSSTVGASAVNLMKNIVQAPMKIIDPTAP